MAKRRRQGRPKLSITGGRATIKAGDELLVPVTDGYLYRVNAGGRSWQIKHLYSKSRIGHTVVAYDPDAAAYFLLETNIQKPELVAKHVSAAIESMLVEHKRPMRFGDAIQNLGIVALRRRSRGQ